MEAWLKIIQCVQFLGFFPIVGIFGGQVGINFFKWGFFLQAENPYISHFLKEKHKFDILLTKFKILDKIVT